MTDAERKAAARQFAADWRGRRAGAVHPLHHVIRIGICALLVLGFYFF